MIVPSRPEFITRIIIIIILGLSRVYNSFGIIARLASPTGIKGVKVPPRVKTAIVSRIGIIQKYTHTRDGCIRASRQDYS